MISGLEGGGALKYGSLKSFVRIGKSKVILPVVAGVAFWPIIGGYLIHNDIVEPALGENVGFAFGFAFLLSAVCSPRRRLLMTLAFAKNAAIRGWNGRICSKCTLLCVHIVVLLSFVGLMGSAKKGNFFILPLWMCLGFGCLGIVFLFWRPLILRLLFGCDKQTRTFDALK